MGVYEGAHTHIINLPSLTLVMLSLLILLLCFLQSLAQSLWHRISTLESELDGERALSATLRQDVSDLASENRRLQVEVASYPQQIASMFTQVERAQPELESTRRELRIERAENAEVCICIVSSLHNV